MTRPFAEPMMTVRLMFTSSGPLWSLQPIEDGDHRLSP